MNLLFEREPVKFAEFDKCIPFCLSIFKSHSRMSLLDMYVFVFTSYVLAVSISSLTFGWCKVYFVYLRGGPFVV